MKGLFGVLSGVPGTMFVNTRTRTLETFVTAASAPIAASAAQPQIAQPASISTAIVEQSTSIVNLFGYNINMSAVLILAVLLGVFFLFWRIQKSEKLDFADMITKDGKAVSLTKILQLIGGITATWIMIKLTITGGLTEALFGLYLTYVGAIEGYSKFVAAKYGYNEKSVKDIAKKDTE